MWPWFTVAWPQLLDHRERSAVSLARRSGAPGQARGDGRGRRRLQKDRIGRGHTTVIPATAGTQLVGRRRLFDSALGSRLRGNDGEGVLGSVSATRSGRAPGRARGDRARWVPGQARDDNMIAVRAAVSGGAVAAVCTVPRQTLRTGRRSRGGRLRCLPRRGGGFAG